MKKSILILLFFLNFVFNGQSQSVISGKIDGFNKAKITIKSFDFSKKIKFDRKSKSFSTSINTKEPTIYSLYFGKRKIDIFLDKNNTVNITGKIENGKITPHFEGSNKKTNTYLLKKKSKFRKVIKNTNDLYSLNEVAFLAKMKTYKDTLNLLLKKSNLDNNYSDFERRNVNYSHIINLGNYEKFHGIMTKNETFKVSKNFPKNIVDLNNANDYKKSLQYRKLINEHLKNLYQKGDELGKLNIINTEIKNPFIKNYILYKTAMNGIQSTGYLKDYFNKFNEYSTNSSYKNDIKKKYDFLKNTASGEPSPKFNGYLNFKGGTTSFDDLTNKGKYLYIMFWGTWGTFSKREFSHFNAVAKKYKNIEEIGIAMKPDKIEHWKEAVKEGKLEGIQLFSGETVQKSEFTKQYHVRGLPRFILVSPNGTIISPNAPRPSNTKKIEELFNKNGIK